MAARRRISQFAIYALVVLFPIVGDGKRGAQPQPVWRFDLKEVGYHRTEYAKAKFYTLSVVRTKISFLGPDTIVAAFATGSPKQPPITGTWTLHVVTLDAHTGRLKLHKTFPIAGHEAGIFVSADDKLIVWLGTTLTLFSPEFQIIKQRELPKATIRLGQPVVFSLPEWAHSLCGQYGSEDRRDAGYPYAGVSDDV